MIRIDGSQQSGSGTIVRLSVALAALLGEPLHLYNARARREKPGLRPQHLSAVRACAEMCDAETDGLSVGSSEFTFRPGTKIRGGEFAWDIGTAGSTTMLALCVLPLACFADSRFAARITGGVFQDFAPSPHHTEHVLAPMLRRMGVEVDLVLVRAGYVPRGAGVVELRVRPASGTLAPIRLAEQGKAGEVRGIAFASHLAARRVSDRMAEACEARLRAGGLRARIDRTDDTLAAHPGASLAVWTETSEGCVLGADRAGAPRRSSEAIGRYVAESLLADLATGATTDLHLADQLVPFATVAEGASGWIVPRATEHVASNLWLAERFGARPRVEGLRVEIEGLGVRRSG